MPASWRCRVHKTNISVRISQISFLLQPVFSHIIPDIISVASVFLCQAIWVSFLQDNLSIPAAIRLHHIEHGAPDPTADDLLQLVCRGIRCIQGDNKCTSLPVTVNVMHILKEQLRQSTFSIHEQRMLWSAFTIAFYGFLRVSEYANLCCSDVTCSVDHLSIKLQQSKTDPFRRGCTINIFEKK